MGFRLFELDRLSKGSNNHESSLGVEGDNVEDAPSMVVSIGMSDKRVSESVPAKTSNYSCLSRIRGQPMYLKFTNSSARKQFLRLIVNYDPCQVMSRNY
jgi:hypothetical protein